MKKILFCFLFLLLPVLFFSESYKIKNAEYDISGSGFKIFGKTREYPLSRKFPLDTHKIFDSRENLEIYLDNYKKSLESSRDFDEVILTYEAGPASDDLYEVIVLLTIKDSHHFLLMPYPRYSSNDGISLKLKAKDTNFLGTLNTMNAEMNFKYNDKTFKPGFNFNFDAPFGLGPFDALFVNDYSLNYAITDEYHGFEWDTETGLELSLPFKRISLTMGLYQYTHRNFSYKEYDDEIYFSERFNLGLPVRIATLSNFSSIYYSPSASITWNWDFDGINPENDSLSGPEVTFSHSLSNSKINWEHNFRKGYSLSLDNSFSYNIQRNDIVPSVSFHGQFFWNYQANTQEIWDRFGICSNIKVFHYFDIPSNTYKYGNSIGDDLRGILDDNYFGNEKPYGTASSAIVINLDFPHNVFTAHFPKEILDFNFQFSPFYDMALVYDRNENRYFNFKDGFYCAGFEFLIYPLKWSSITVRASLGIDLSQNIFVEGLKNNKEIFIGIGLQY